MRLQCSVSFVAKILGRATHKQVQICSEHSKLDTGFDEEARLVTAHFYRVMHLQAPVAMVMESHGERTGCSLLPVRLTE